MRSLIFRTLLREETLPNSLTHLEVFQTVAGAFSVSAAQSLFTNRLIETLPRNAPGLSPSQVVATGATDLRNTFPNPSDLNGILKSYITGLKASWAVGIALAGVAVLASFAPERKNIKNDKA